MIRDKGVLPSSPFRAPFPHFPRKRQELFGRTLVGRYAAHDSIKGRKAKFSPAHQGKFHLAPLSPSASAYAAHAVKGRYLFLGSKTRLRHKPLFALDLLALLRHPLLTTAAPREISPKSRKYNKAEKASPACASCPSSLSPFPAPRFSGASLSLFPGEPEAFPASIMRFPLVRTMLSGSSAFAFLRRSFRLPHAGLFVRHHPGRPAYVTYIRAVALYPLRLARGFAPLTPGRPAKGSGLGKGIRR